MSSMNDCRPWTQKSASGILYGQAEDARSMLLFATGFKCPRAGKKHKPAARRCLWRIIVKGAVAKVSTRRLRADGATSGRAYGRADVGAAHVWRRAAARVWAAYGYKIGKYTAAGIWAHQERANGLKGLCVGHFFASRKELFTALKQVCEVFRAHGAGIEKSLRLDSAQPGQKLPLRSVFNAFAQHPHI